MVTFDRIQKSHDYSYFETLFCLLLEVNSCIYGNLDSVNLVRLPIGDSLFFKAEGKKGNETLSYNVQC